jgi:cytochrome d ubiquinol oxidase subunit I
MSRKSFSAALIVATVASLAAAVSGHFQARNVYRHQPAKLAAFDAVFETTEGGTPFSLFGVPDEEAGKVKAAINVPGLLSFLVHDDTTTPVIGLDRIPREDWPPVAMSYYSYHVMIYLGSAFIVLTLVALVLHWRGSLFDKRWLLWVFVFAVIGPYVANQVGWVAAEVGRQPWVVHPVLERDQNGEFVLSDEEIVQYEHQMVTGSDGSQQPHVAALRTADALSPVVTGEHVLGSIIMFSFIYLMLLAVWLYLMDHKIRIGPEPVGEAEREGKAGLMAAASALAGHRDSMTESRGDGASSHAAQPERDDAWS